MGKTGVPSITTLDGLLRIARKVRSESDEPLWFRGCHRASYPLLPGIFRHPDTAAIPDENARLQEFASKESRLIAWFHHRRPVHDTRPLDPGWQELFFMQHYRLPTRLLDWTESPLVALYFALSRRGGSPISAQGHPASAAVWLLKPIAWNNEAMEKVVDKPTDIPFCDDSSVEYYGPGQSLRVRPELPVAVRGTHNNPRIAAQKGVFVVFGKDMRPMEQIHRDEGYPADLLVQVQVPEASRKALWSGLRETGLTDSAVFPDLEGLAMEAKREFGFGG